MASTPQSPSTEASRDDRATTAKAKQRPADHNVQGNAFAELMSPKKSKPPPSVKSSDAPSKKTTFMGRDGLLPYTQDPQSFPSSRVVYYNEKFVVINDLYPKATVHLLILPRDPKKNRLRGQEAFDDTVFLDDCKVEVQHVRAMVAEELRRKLGPFSAAERPRIEAMESDKPPSTLPPGRDWDREIIVGTHANPSMSHLHIHVLSRDMHSDCMRNKNHYLSFTTDFLIPIEAYPLAKDDFRRNYKHFTSPDMQCWRCDRRFGNRSGMLKEHLEEEFISWKRE